MPDGANDRTPNRPFSKEQQRRTTTRPHAVTRQQVAMPEVDAPGGTREYEILDVKYI